MLKRNSKAIAFVMAFAICLTVIAPFFAVAPAAAASTYTVLKTENVSQTGIPMTNVKIQIDVANVAALTAGDVVTLHLPKGLLFDSAAYAVTFSRASAAGKIGIGAGGVPGAAPAVGEDINVNAPLVADGSANAFDAAAGNFSAYAVGTNTLDIKVGAAPNWGACTAGRLVVEFNSVLVDDTFDGDIKVNFSAPANSGFSSALGLAVAKYVSSSQGTTSMAKSVTNMGTERTNMDVIMVQESVKGALKSGEEIKLKLDNGFRWQTSTTPVAAPTAISPQWGYQGLFAINAPAAAAGDNAGCYYFANGNQELYIKMPLNLTSATATAAAINAASEGRLYISNFSIEVADDNIAKKGDVKVNVSSNLGNVTDQDVVIANYVDYTTTVEAIKVEEKVAGWNETELGNIRIKEGLANSLLANRTLSLTLPEGVKWHVNDTDANLINDNWPALEGVNPYTFESETGNLNLGGGNIPTTTSNNGRTIKITVPAHTKSSVLLKKLNVAIAPDFTGDLNVEVGGNAGATGTVKVATIKAPAEITNDGAAKIIIGSQGQAVSDIVIKENIKEAIKADQKVNLGNNANGRNKVVLQLPDGASWTSTPKVEVTEGDMAIDTVSTDSRVLTITTKSSSSKPSSIKISGIKVTTNRLVPEGDFKVKILGSDGANRIASTALTDNANGNFFDKAAVATKVIGQCVTPAPGEGTTGSAAGQFKINSNIYEVNGVAKVMDAAPYIKAGRTYVPVKFLGLALGVAENDIVWDAAAQKATLTLGDKKVELTIGSTSYTVNGEAKTMDVAPEIVNGRTMLPAKYVAEGLGFNVGWDAATGTVLVSK